MSWDEPIEQEILRYVRHMKRSWLGHFSVWPGVRRAAQIYASAYETVEKHIVREIEMREEIAGTRKKRRVK